MVAVTQQQHKGISEILGGPHGVFRVTFAGGLRVASSFVNQGLLCHNVTAATGAGCDPRAMASIETSLSVQQSMVRSWWVRCSRCSAMDAEVNVVVQRAYLDAGRRGAMSQQHGLCMDYHNACPALRRC